MKKTRPLAKAVLLSLFLTVFAMNASAQKVTLSFQNETFEKVLNSIKQQTGLSLVFSEQLVDLNRKVSINVHSIQVEDALKQLLTDTNLSFEIKSNKLFLVEKKIIEPQISLKQPKKISGLVTDEKGEPIIGASVVLMGTSTGTITSIDGMFGLEAQYQSELIISYIGYKQTILKIGKANNYKITLEEDSKTLDEIVVVGYGRQKKSSLTGAITTLNAKELLSVPRPNIFSALQGRIAGLTVTESTGDPNSSPTLLLRGKGTIDGDTSPLVILDGVPTGTLSQIPANDIETISVLKDGSAAAIYGARAANGVILVTTKQGAKDSKKPILEFNSYTGFQTLAQFPEVMNAYQYASMTNEIAQNEGHGEYFIFSEDDIQKYKNSQYDDYHANTNWKNEIIKTVSPSYTNHLSVTGNNKLGRYYISGEYMKQNGMVKEIDQRERINLRANITSDITDKLQLQFSTNLIRTYNISGGLSSMFNSIITTSPTSPVRYADGHWAESIIANDAKLRDSSNPVKNINEYGPNENYWTSMNSSFSLNYTPIKGLIINAMGSYRNSWSDSQQYSRSWSIWDPITESVSQSGVASLTENWTKEYKYDFQTTATYEKKINDHTFKILGGMSTENLRSDYIQAHRKNFINNSIYELNAGDASTYTNAGGADQWSFASFFGRLNYSFSDKYLFEANFRYDGSSRFAIGKQWGAFPSVSLGWVINKENFMKDITSVDQLKLRASVGQLGNAEKVGLYQWFKGVNSGAYYNMDGSLIFGTRPGDPANSDLKWETTTFYNLGLDGSLWKEKLTFEFDLWRKNTDGVLLSMPISSIVGSSTGNMTMNAGKVASQGFDLSIGTRGNFTKDFAYRARLSLTGWNSWVVDLKNRATSFSTEYRPGEDLGNYYGYECLGIITDKKTLDTYKKIENVAPQTSLGDLQYKDQNGDGRLDYMDVVKIGNWETKNSFGLNLDLIYKGFDMQIFFQGAFNVDKKISGITQSPDDYGNSDINKLDRWTTENNNANALYPRLRREYASINTVSSSFWIKDASYVKLKNFQIGYTLPSSVISKMKFTNCRFYVSATNLFTYAPHILKGYDPESDMVSTVYPTLRVYAVGFNIQF